MNINRKSSHAGFRPLFKITPTCLQLSSRRTDPELALISAVSACAYGTCYQDFSKLAYHQPQI